MTDHHNQSEPRPATYTVAEAAKILGIGRSTAYEAVMTGAIPSLRFGGRCVRVPRRAIERMLLETEGEAA